MYITCVLLRNTHTCFYGSSFNSVVLPINQWGIIKKNEWKKGNRLVDLKFFQHYTSQCRKMVRHTLKILQHLVQDLSVSDHFTTLQSKGLKSKCSKEYLYYQLKLIQCSISATSKNSMKSKVVMIILWVQKWNVGLKWFKIFICIIDNAPCNHAAK